MASVNGRGRSWLESVSAAPWALDIGAAEGVDDVIGSEVAPLVVGLYFVCFCFGFGAS